MTDETMRVVGPVWPPIVWEGMSDAMIVSDAEGRVCLENPAAAALTGWPPEEAEGRPLREVLRVVGGAEGRPVPLPASATDRDEGMARSMEKLG